MAASEKSVRWAMATSVGSVSMRSTSSTKSAGSEPASTSCLAVGRGAAMEELGVGLGEDMLFGALAVQAAHTAHEKRAKRRAAPVATALFELRFLAMGLTLGIVTDLHFGPEARWHGKLRKMSHRAGEFTRGFAQRMRDEVHPDFVVNLGDDIEDESRAADLARYEECQSLLAKAGVPVVNVAGNHDTVNLGPEDLLAVWARTGH